MRVKKPSLDTIIETASELEGLLETVSVSADGDVKSELSQLKNYAHIIVCKLPKIQKLIEFKGYRFAVIDPATGNVRKASYDEAMRLIMDYQEGNVFDIVRKFDVESGKWVERKVPREKPIVEQETQEVDEQDVQ